MSWIEQLDLNEWYTVTCYVYSFNAFRIEPVNDTHNWAVIKVKVMVTWIYIAPSREASKALRHGSQFYLQTTPCLPLPCKHSPDGVTTDYGSQTSNCSLLLNYQPQKGERLSWPGWLTYSGWFTHISGHPSAVGGVQDRESLPVKDQRSTTVPRDQPRMIMNCKWNCPCLLSRDQDNRHETKTETVLTYLHTYYSLTLRQ